MADKQKASDRSMADSSFAPDNESPTQEESVPKLLGVSIGIRLIFDSGVQLFNPFLPLIATGLQISEVALGSLVGLRNLTGLIGPYFGALADRRSYRLVMSLGLVLAGIGSIVVGLSSSWWLTVLAMVVWGVGMAAFTPSLHAYVSARLPYAQRARGIGILEYSWALAGIVGLYLIGFLIDWQGWRAPFFVLGTLMLLFSIVVWRFFSPLDRTPRSISPGRSQSSGIESNIQSEPVSESFIERLKRFFDLGSNQISAYATMIGSTFLFFGAVQLMITHGLWLRTEYGFGAIQLGTVALIMGLADLCGSVSVSLFADRLGKRRSVIVGAVGALLGYILMPSLNSSAYAAVASLFFARSTFEFGIVSNISLLSEQVPEQRGKVFTLAGAFNLLGSATAGISGPWIYQQYGVSGLATLSGIVTILCLFIYWIWVQDVE